MFELFRKKNVSSRMEDIEGNELKPGDQVVSYRYDLGECILISSDKGIEYQSIEKGIRVHYSRMIDATTGRQKVKKLS
jgi:hypothetical protein